MMGGSGNNTDPWNGMVNASAAPAYAGLLNPNQQMTRSQTAQQNGGGINIGSGGLQNNYGGGLFSGNNDFGGSNSSVPNEIPGGTITGGTGSNWGNLVGQMLGAMTPVPGGALFGNMLGGKLAGSGLAPTSGAYPAIQLATPINTIGTANMFNSSMQPGDFAAQVGQNLGGGWTVGPSAGGGKGSQQAGSHANLINGGTMVLPNGDVVGSGAGAGWQNTGSGAYTGASDFAHGGHWANMGM